MDMIGGPGSGPWKKPGSGWGQKKLGYREKNDPACKTVKSEDRSGLGLVFVSAHGKE
jgi:hypothetical protein